MCVCEADDNQSPPICVPDLGNKRYSFAFRTVAFGTRCVDGAEAPGEASRGNVKKTRNRRKGPRPQNCSLKGGGGGILIGVSNLSVSVNVVVRGVLDVSEVCDCLCLCVSVDVGVWVCVCPCWLVPGARTSYTYF